MSARKDNRKLRQSDASPEDSEAEETEPQKDESVVGESSESSAEPRSDEADESERASVSARVKTPRVRNVLEAKAVVECLLFATTDPLSLKQIREIVSPINMTELRLLLVELQNEYDSRGSGLQIVEVAGGYQMATRPRYADWLEAICRRKHKTGFSVAMLETLAIIAYRQPIVRAEVDAIRGVDSSGVIHALQELDLIEAVGQKQVPGRPYLYGTTKTFLKHFGLRSLSELPSIESLRERFGLDQR